jgi:hypothetical protein
VRCFVDAQGTSRNVRGERRRQPGDHGIRANVAERLIEQALAPMRTQRAVRLQSPVQHCGAAPELSLLDLHDAPRWRYMALDEMGYDAFDV